MPQITNLRTCWSARLADLECAGVTTIVRWLGQPKSGEVYGYEHIFRLELPSLIVEGGHTNPCTLRVGIAWRSAAVTRSSVERWSLERAEWTEVCWLPQRTGFPTRLMTDIYGTESEQKLQQAAEQMYAKWLIPVEQELLAVSVQSMFENEVEIPTISTASGGDDVGTR